MQWLADIVWEMFSPILNNTIAMWSGTLATIPDGWVLCDGDNGTPDLRNRFVACASDDVGDVPHVTLDGLHIPGFAGSAHKHVYEETYHAHAMRQGYVVDPGSEHDVWDGWSINSSTHPYSPSGITDDQKVITVPYFALAFIMRLPA